MELTPEDRASIDKMLNSGNHPVREVKRALILDALDRGYSSEQIAKIVGVTPETARRTGWKYVRGGFQRAVSEPSRPGKERALTEKQANKIIAMVCSKPPEGHCRWTIELVTEQAKKRGIVREVGRETIRVLLHSHDLKPWREKNVVYS